MPQDQSAYLSAHLSQSFPGVSPDVVESFVLSCCSFVQSRPTPEELLDLEDRFAVHLSLLDEARECSPNRKVTRMEDSQENIPKPEPAKQDEWEQPEEGSSAVDMLNILQLSFQKEENFKLLCNAMFKGVKYFVQDPSNPVFRTIPLPYADMENSEAVITQVQYLCTEFEIEFAAKEKGALLTFTRTDPFYVKEVSKLLEAFKQHKEESLVRKVIEEKKKGGYNPMDPNGAERIAAFFEARRLRGIVGPAPVTMSEPQNFNFNQGNNFSNQIAITDYPAPPQQGNPGLNPGGWNGQGEDPLAQRFRYTMDDRHLRTNANNALSHHNQLEEYRNKVRFNNHQAVAPRQQFMTWGQLSNKIDTEDQEVLGKLCLEWTNKFRQAHGKSALTWEPSMFKIGKL